MKKRVFGRQLSRDFGSRHALFRALISALVKHGKINTTKAKAKAIQPDAERLVTMAKTKDVARMRKVYAFLANDYETTNKIFDQVTKAFENKTSGFTRIVNLPRRIGDNAEMARIEWTEKVAEVEKTLSKKDQKIAEKKVAKKEVKKEAKKSTLSKLTKMVKGKK